MLGLGVVHLVPVHKHDDVGILLDGSGFTQVGVDRALVGPLLKGTVELRQRHYRAVELFGQCLEGSRNLGNFVGTVVTARTRDLHQLQVVDHDQADITVLTHQSSGTGAHFRRADTGRIVNKQLAVVEQVDRRGQAWPIVVFKTTGPDLGLVDTAQGRQHTHDQRFAWHLEGVDQYCFFTAQNGVFNQVHRKGGFTHRWTTRHNDQVGRLQAAGHAVQVGVAGGQASDGVVSVEQCVDAVDGLGQQVVDADRAAGFWPGLGNRKDLALGFIEDFFGAAPFRVEGAVGDFGADADQLTQGRALAHDLGVGLDVGDRRRVFRQLTEVAQATHLRGLTFLVQLLGKGHDVDRGVLVCQLGDGAEDQAVVMSIEITVRNLIQHAFPGVVVQHQTTEHSLFGLDGMRRHLQGCGL